MFNVNVPVDFLEALSSVNATQTEKEVVLVILRKTLGWNKEWDSITKSTFQQMTCSNKRTIYRALNSLEKDNMILKRDSSLVIAGHMVPEYSLVMSPGDWDRESSVSPSSENMQEESAQAVKKEDWVYDDLAEEWVNVG